MAASPLPSTASLHAQRWLARCAPCLRAPPVVTAERSQLHRDAPAPRSPGVAALRAPTSRHSPSPPKAHARCDAPHAAHHELSFESGADEPRASSTADDGSALSAFVPSLLDVVCKLSSVPSNAERAVREAGGIPILVALLDVRSHAIQRRAADALLRVSSASPANAALVCEAGGEAVVMILVELLEGATSAEPEAAEAAASAAAVLWALSSMGALSGEALREAGGIVGLVGMLAADAASVGVTNALLALECIALDESNGAAILEAGGVPPLVALLAPPEQSGAPAEVSETAAAVIWNLAATLDEALCDALCESGAVKLLVGRLISGGEGATSAAGTLWYLSVSHSRLICEAGGTEPLAALALSGGEAGTYAASALQNLKALQSAKVSPPHHHHPSSCYSWNSNNSTVSMSPGSEARDKEGGASGNVKDRYSDGEEVGAVEYSETGSHVDSVSDEPGR
ncbi:hypothetical protein AB1Y20_005199 [Prymnesium parvum]|uniref:Armadillo repeat-containing protein 8 n=1 Tax=Prymnesium parvum TaxID=97485 RepID=A0AB34J2P3_PRYPA